MKLQGPSVRLIVPAGEAPLDSRLARIELADRSQVLSVFGVQVTILPDQPVKVGVMFPNLDGQPVVLTDKSTSAPDRWWDLTKNWFACEVIEVRMTG